MLGDVAPGGAERSSQADLGTSFEDRDDHDIGDADAADEEGDGTETDEQPVVGAFGGYFGLEDVGGEGVGHGGGVGRVDGGVEHVGHRVDLAGHGP